MTGQRRPMAKVNIESSNGLTIGSKKGPLIPSEDEVVGGGPLVGRDGGSRSSSSQHDIKNASTRDGKPSTSRGGTEKSVAAAAAPPPPRKPVLLVESDDDVEEWPEVPLIRNRNEAEEYSSDDHGEPAHSDGDDEEDCDHEMFWKHKVKQNDTLAGLAVKYKVSISDIKRANGFQTDTAMFGREWVMIPRKPFPIGPEHAAWAGMILAHYEQRMPFGMHPEGNGMNDKPLTSVRALRGYYSTDHSPVRQQQQYADWEAEGASKKNEDGHLVAPASARGEVEMMSRSTSSYRDDRLRRRRNDEDFVMTTPLRNDMGDYDENDPAVRQVFEAMRDRDMPKPLFGPQTTAKFNSWKEKSSILSSNAMKELKDLQTKSLKWKDQLLHRIKKVTNQPGPSSSAAAAASRSTPSFSSSIKKD